MKDVKHVITVLILCTFFLPCFATNNKDNSFTLTGRVTGQHAGKIIITSYSELSVYKTDTIKITNGEFIYKGFIKEPKQIEIEDENENNKISFWIEPGIMHIHLVSGKYSLYELSGSKTENEQKEYTKLVEKSFVNIREIESRLKILNLKIRNTSDDKAKKDLENIVELVEKEIQHREDKLLSLSLQFIKSHPESYISLVKLSDIVLKVADNKTSVISIDSLRRIFNGLDNNLKTGVSCNLVQKDLDKIIQNSIGKYAPDFCVIDINNQMLKLTSFKGKSVVLLDFWASYCSPCRSSFHFTKTLYQQFHTKGIDVIAIDMDTDEKDSWLKAIRKDSIEMWHNVRISNNDGVKSTESNIKDKYYVQSIPRKILIDKNGIIVGNWVGTCAEIEREVEEKVEELVNK